MAYWARISEAGARKRIRWILAAGISSTKGRNISVGTLWQSTVVRPLQTLMPLTKRRLSVCGFVVRLL